MKEKKKRNILVPIILICILLVPLIYSGFYLDAFWDPYSAIDKLPVAVVNQDKGALINGEEKNLGQEMCDRLKDEKPLKITFTDEQSAKKGTDGNLYYATITIPEDFSSKIATASDTKKQQAVIQFSQNEKKNYLAVTILKSAMSEIQKSVVADVDKEIVANLSDQLKAVPDKMTDLSKGLTQLKQGSSKLANGTKTLMQGTATLKNGVGSLKKGASKVNSGALKLSNGAETLNSGASELSDKLGTFDSGVKSVAAGSKELTKGAKSLGSGISALKEGASKLDTSTKDIEKLSNGAAELANQAEQFNQGMVAYTDGVTSLVQTLKSTINSTSSLFQYLSTTEYKDVLADPKVQEYSKMLSTFSDPQSEAAQSVATLEESTKQMKQYSSQISEATKTLSSKTASLPELKKGVTQLKTGLISAQKGTKKLQTGAEGLEAGLIELNSASSKLSEGASSLASGAEKLQTGAKSLAVGGKSLSDGLDRLGSGASDLTSGVKALNSGAVSLNNGMQDAKKQVKDSIKTANQDVKKLNGLDEYAGNPVEVQKDSYNKVENYGTSFTPYFMSLSLWVGALIALMGIYYDVESKFKRLSRNGEKHVFRTFAYLGIGILQSIILSIALMLILGLKVQELGLYFAASLVVSLTFTAIVQFLLIYLKDIGKFVSIILLILQLCSSGGTFPIELVPSFFQKISPFLPMTYSVDLFREVTCGSTESIAWKNIGILAVYFIIFAGITFVLSIRHDIVSSKEDEGQKADMKPISAI